MAYQEYIGDYKGGLATAMQLLHLFQNSFLQSSNTYIAIGFKQIATFYGYLRDFDNALLFIEKAKHEDKNSKHNYLLFIGIQFRILYYQGNYEKASELLYQLSSSDSNFYKSVYAYYNACCAFWKKGPLPLEENNFKVIEKNKEVWNVFIRMLAIMHLLERNQADVAKSRIENLRKHIERTQKTSIVTPRLILILKAFRELAKNNFNYQITYKKTAELFQKLSSETILEYKWEMFSPELIRFDVWFESKVRRLPYQTVFNERIEKVKSNQ